MRKMISVLLAGVLAVNLGACSSAASKASKEAESAAPAGTTAQESGGKRTLRIAGESWQVTKLFLNEAAEAFMKDHPDVTVEVQTYADPTVVSNYSINWQKGDTPCDLVVIDGASFAEQFVTKDLIYDFDQDLKFLIHIPRISSSPAALEMAKLHDKQYVIPVIQEVTAININKAMFKDAGLVDENGDALVPKTWDDVYEFAKKLTKTENGVVTQQGCTIQWSKDIHGTVLGILQASCGGLYQEDGITVNFQSQEFKDILAIWQKGVKEGCSPPRHLLTTMQVRTVIKLVRLPCFFSQAPTGWKRFQRLERKMHLLYPSQGRREWISWICKWRHHSQVFSKL